MPLSIQAPDNYAVSVANQQVGVRKTLSMTKMTIRFARTAMAQLIEYIPLTIGLSVGCLFAGSVLLIMGFVKWYIN